MDIPKNNSETAAGCKDLTTKVPPNKNKDSFDGFDDKMPSVDEWMDYDDDEDTSEANQSDTASSPPQSVTEIPPKDDSHRPSSEVSLPSPKNKKRKFSNLDQILQNLSFDTLSLKFTKFLMFLESDHKELALPFTLVEYEEVFILIVKDINVLKSTSLDAKYRYVCDKILKAASGYLLTYAYEYKTEFKQVVMVIRKEKNRMVDRSEESPCSFSRSENCTNSSSQTSKPTISSGFKLHCLRTMLAFIKHAETKSKEFPELSLYQAQYMEMLLRYSSAAFKEFEKNSEIKHLHRTLWEAMKIYSRKYEFRITCEESWGGKKNLMFEKIPKQKCSIPMVEIDSNPLMNPTIEFKNPEMLTPETQKSEISGPENAKSENSKSESPMPVDEAEPWFAKPEIPKFAPVRKIPRITKNMQKRNKLENEILYIKNQSSQFISDTLKTIIAFLLDDEQHKLVLVPKTIYELEFYRKVFKWCRVEYNASLFGEELESLHHKVQSLLLQVKIKATKDSFKKSNETTGYKEMTYLKVPPKHKHLISVDPDTAQSAPKKKKKVNLPNVLELAGTGQIQLSSVVDLNQSLRSKKKNKKQKKAKLKKANALASNEASSKAANKSRGWSDDSSSTNSSRVASRDRNGAVPKAQQVDNNEASAKAANKGRLWSDDSSSTNSSRATSRDRTGAVPKAQQVDTNQLTTTEHQPKPPITIEYGRMTPAAQTVVVRPAAIEMAWYLKLNKLRTGVVPKAHPVFNKKASSMLVNAKTSTEDCRRGNSKVKVLTAQLKLRKAKKEQVNRKEQLIEALSVPVQSDKATRMMRGMGWDGGALGARGNGLLEPLMPKLEFPRGMGLGSSPETTPKRSKNTKTPTSWVAETKDPKVVEIVETKQDSTVLKKDLLTENLTCDSVKKTVDVPKQSDSNVEPSKSNVELPTQTKSNVELPKPETPFTELVLSQTFSRYEYLENILDLLESNYNFKTLKYQNTIPMKGRKFVKNVVGVINKRTINYGFFVTAEFPIYTQIHVKCKKSPQTFVYAEFLPGFKAIELKKTPTDLQTPTESVTQPIVPIQPETNSEIITEEQVKTYIFLSKTTYNSAKSFALLKFKVLFLLNTLNFVKSLNEEVEISFSKILKLGERDSILNFVDAINMRINFGSSPAEKQLSMEIKEHVKDAFLGAMFNHQYTVVTLNKYYRFKRLNRPDNAVKRKSQTTVNLDIYKSETVSQPKVNIYEPTDKENNNKTENHDMAFRFSGKNYIKVDENSITIVQNNDQVAESRYEEVLLESDDAITNPYDGDESRIEEYNNNNNATAKVPKLHPGEENVNMPNFLCYYEKEKANSHVKNNAGFDSASKISENINNKNNIGNGNVVIDNNDNQIIDMKKDGDYKTTNVRIGEGNDFDLDDSEYSVEMSVDIGKEDEKINIKDNERAGFNEKPIENSFIAAINNVRLVNQNEHENNGVDKFDGDINEEDLLKTDHSDIEELNSHHSPLTLDCWENLFTDEENDIPENLDKNYDGQDQNVIMKENVTEIVEVISIKDNEDLAKANQEKTAEVAKINEETSISQSDDQNVRQETRNLDIKNDCDILKKEDIGLSEKKCDTQPVVFRFGTVMNVPDSIQDMDSEIKTVHIVHSCHPLTKLTKENVTEIQKQLSNAIMMSIELPLLKCDGIQFGALVYTCHNKKTYDWLLNTISVASNVRVLNTHKITKMALKFYCFFDYNSSLYLFKMIELYNRELSTEKWIVEKTEKDGDYVIFIVKMDKFSIKFIQESGYSLFAGVDKVQFTPIWE